MAWERVSLTFIVLIREVSGKRNASFGKRFGRFLGWKWVLGQP